MSSSRFLFTVVVMPIHVSLRWVHRDLIGPSLPETRPQLLERSLLERTHRFQQIHIHAPCLSVFPVSLCLSGCTSLAVVLFSVGVVIVPFRFTWVASCASPRFSSLCELED